jgi:hypothetical protein
MHRRAEAIAPTAALGRVAIGALARLHRIVLIAGVFFFALALTTLAVSGSPNRTVNLEFSHSEVVSH